MSKEKQIVIKMDLQTAAAVRQVLFDAQKGYTYNEISIPPRIMNIRTIINALDSEIEICIDKK